MESTSPSHSRRNIRKTTVTLPPAEIDLHGHLQFWSQRHQERYSTIFQLTILWDKSLHRPSVVKLCIVDAVDALIQNSCWEFFCSIHYPIYIELVHDFYSTFEFTPPAHPSTPNAVEFRLSGRSFTLSVTDFNLAFGFIDTRSIGLSMGRVRPYPDLDKKIPSKIT
ncbi:UNVERIFIED_CONTAM: hypothetical protein Slati_1677300 [Sesamum latifolium]|uniref:Arabidopsis retrotransposon Orf1 C-terminal domain-containing protein n=1 Tax=Sesamum latifolium TaxID=2727402 RepID=A0AAW2WUX7_9LAMI